MNWLLYISVAVHDLYKVCHESETCSLLFSSGNGYFILPCLQDVWLYIWQVVRRGTSGKMHYIETADREYLQAKLIKLDERRWVCVCHLHFNMVWLRWPFDLLITFNFLCTCDRLGYECQRASNTPSIRSLVLDEEWMRPGWRQCCVFPLVLRHFWLNNCKNCRNLCHVSPKILFQNKWSRTANPGGSCMW